MEGAVCKVSLGSTRCNLHQIPQELPWCPKTQQQCHCPPSVWDNPFFSVHEEQNSPKEFNGIKLSFLEDGQDSTEDYNNFERIPSWFWLGPTYEKLPINKIYRKRLCSALLDYNHKDICSIETFHIPDEECICKFCKGSCSHFHERYCPERT